MVSQNLLTDPQDRSGLEFRWRRADPGPVLGAGAHDEAKGRPDGVCAEGEERPTKPSPGAMPTVYGFRSTPRILREFAP